MIRRSTSNTNLLSADDLELNPKELTVKRVEKNIQLSKIEFKILEFMFMQKGSILSEKRIIDHVWYDSRDISSNVVAAHIKNLRGKIDKAFTKSTQLIKTIIGLGYKIFDE